MTDQEKELIYLLAQRLTGAHPEGSVKHEIFVNNVQKRMREKNCTKLIDYLELADADPTEHAQLVSALSIHTTSLFRENPHFVITQQILLDSLKSGDKFRIWVAAASTGEEVYSFALLLEEFRRINPRFDYSILGTDIDAISIEHAKRGIYSKRLLSGPASFYKNHVLLGSGPTEDYFTFTKELRSRCHFQVQDLRQPVQVEVPYNIIACRNVLIYFDGATVSNVVNSLKKSLAPEGHLILGHSEIIEASKYDLKLKGHSVYQLPAKRGAVKPTDSVANQLPTSKLATPQWVADKKSPFKGIPAALIVDDAKLARDAVQLQLEKLGLETTHAATLKEAETEIRKGKFDLMVLDINLPDGRGDNWLTEIRTRGVKIPTLVLSDAHPSEAKEVFKILESGAQAYIDKGDFYRHPDMLRQTVSSIIDESRTTGNETLTLHKRMPRSEFSPELILIGASTGGPTAVANVLAGLPSDCPPVLVVQHISPKFAQPYAERLAATSCVKMGKIENHGRLLRGHFYMAMGDYHINVESKDNEYYLLIKGGDRMNGHRPSVDHLFFSACNIKRDMIAVLLTGMGRDGATGMAALHQKGAYTMAQTQHDCVVFGMPREAIRRNAVEYVGTSMEIHSTIVDILRSAAAKKSA